MRSGTVQSYVHETRNHRLPGKKPGGISNTHSGSIEALQGFGTGWLTGISLPVPWLSSPGFSCALLFSITACKSVV